MSELIKDDISIIEATLTRAISIPDGHKKVLNSYTGC